MRVFYLVIADSAGSTGRGPSQAVTSAGVVGGLDSEDVPALSVCAAAGTDSHILLVCIVSVVVGAFFTF